MASNKNGAPTNARAISKQKALAFCEDAMNKTLRTVNGGREYRIAIPDDSLAEQVAASVGGTLIGTAAGPLVRGVATRVAIVRLSVSLLTTSLVGQSAVAVAPGFVQVEQVATVSGSALSKISVPGFSGSAVKVADTIFEAAAAQQKVIAPIVGESVLIASKASVVFFAVGAILQVLNTANASEQQRSDLQEFKRTGCFDAASKAALTVRKKMPAVFHKLSWKTNDLGGRKYAIKASRRN